MEIARTREDLAGARGSVLVPTMGALHAGHEALIRLARERAGEDGRVSVSIFVNPTQFNESSDFERYPRDNDADLAMCRELGVDVVFVPPREVMYPRDEEVPVGELPAVADGPGLEDEYRPGHFAGVCQVVRRVFVLVEPSAAVFGEKDWQQLQAVRAMSEGEGLGVEIVPGPTVREDDGLALSSRNRLLSPEARGRAVSIHEALSAACGTPSPVAAEVTMRGVLARAEIEPEYAVVREAATLGPVAEDQPARALIAAKVGGVRLIDNAPWSPGGPPAS